MLDSCIIWEGPISRKGYGWQHKGLKVPKPAHRYVWELYRGLIPKGLEIDHLCNKRSCVNLDHLELVTHAENMRRAAERRIRCGNGHLWSTNTYLNKDRSRECRACNTERKRAQKKRERIAFTEISEDA